MNNKCNIYIKKVAKGYYRVVCNEHRNVLGIFCERNGLLDPETLKLVLEDESESILVNAETLELIDDDSIEVLRNNTKRLYYFSEPKDFILQSN